MPASIQRNVGPGTVLSISQYTAPTQVGNTQQRCHRVLKFYNETLNFVLDVRAQIRSEKNLRF